MSTGGPIESLDMGGRLFSVDAEADSNRGLGGFENEEKVYGDGTVGLIKRRVAGSLDGLVVKVDDFRGDHEYLSELTKGDFFQITVVYVSGVIWQGTAQIKGELKYSSMNGQASFALVCQSLTKQ